MEKIIKVQDLEINFQTYAGLVEAVRGVSFSVYEGETLAIVGESGSGKTVTAKSLVGLTEISGGSIKATSKVFYKDKDVLEFSEQEWRNFRGKECAMVFQDALTALNPTMKIGEQIKETINNHMDLARDEVEERVINMLSAVGLPDPEAQMGRYTFELSGGQRQRAMIAMALAAEPNVLIADEPTTALDVTIQSQILDLLEDLQKKSGMTIIIITHDLGIVADIADRIIVLYSGKVMEEGTVYDIFYNHKHPYTWGLLKSIPNIKDSSDEKLVSIEGTPPDLIDPPKGCPFAQRCIFAMNICVEHSAPRFEIDEGHEVFCWLYHEEFSKETFELEDLV